MDSRLANEVAGHAIAKDGVKLKKVRFPFSEMVEDAPGQPLDLDLVPGKEKELRLNDKLVDYTRSKRTVGMLIQNGFEKDVG